jgi:selenocysteine-specific elongation factor
MQHVVATAGHVDHGKSTLVRALTGMEPDRWAEERRRGLTIDLGFAWTDLEPGRTVAFVDVPGHERFVGNMLAGVGPVPAVLLVVAADGGWMPQTQEHVSALDALGVRHAVVAVTRADLADPSPVAAEARHRLERTSLAGSPTVAVSAPDGGGLPELRAALRALVTALPQPDAAAPVRLWVDRSFTVRGAGTVVTGTLPAGTVRVGDTLVVGAREVTVRGIESLGVARDEVPAVARVAVNLRGAAAHDVRRGAALLAADGHWTITEQLDVRTTAELRAAPAQLTLHVGSTAVPVRQRPLDGRVVRLTLRRPLPLAAGDVGLLRDPGRHAVVAGVTVLDPRPRALTRRGAAAERGRQLAALDAGAELARRRVMPLAEMLRLGLVPPVEPVHGWLVDPAHLQGLRDRLPAVVEDHLGAHPLDDGPPIETVARALGLPDRALVEVVVRAPCAVRAGRVVDQRSGLPTYVQDGLDRLAADLRDAPFAAPDAVRLRELGLGEAELAAAERAGRVVRIAPGVVLLPDAPERAAAALAGLPQPFAVSQARTALGSSRRVTVPLLELLDRDGRTRRDAEDRRVVVSRAPT